RPVDDGRRPGRGGAARRGAAPRPRDRRHAQGGRRMIAWSAHLSTLFDELPVLARPAAARAAGLGAVETWWPPAPDPGDWIAAVTGAGVTAALVNADGGDLARGERGYCNDPARAGEVVA